MARPAPGVDDSLHYQIDVAATLLELSGGSVPNRWDGQSFRSSLDSGEFAGRESLILTQGAWTAQRAVRFDDWICIRTFHDSYHGFPDIMLFDLATDPHEQDDLSESRPEVVQVAMTLLEEWKQSAVALSPSGVDPLDTVLARGRSLARTLAPSRVRRMAGADRPGQLGEPSGFRLSLCRSAGTNG